jgi:hypothetical protein
VRTFAPALALSIYAGAHAAAAAPWPCSGTGCGDEFIADGWMKIAECEGHNWSYLLRKGANIVVCTGVNGRAGPIEEPCQIFKGDLAQYRIMAASPRRGAECVMSPAVKGAIAGAKLGARTGEVDR